MKLKDASVNPTRINRLSGKKDLQITENLFREFMGQLEVFLLPRYFRDPEPAAVKGLTNPIQFYCSEGRNYKAKFVASLDDFTIIVSDLAMDAQSRDVVSVLLEKLNNQIPVVDKRSSSTVTGNARSAVEKIAAQYGDDYVFVKAKYDNNNLDTRHRDNTEGLFLDDKPGRKVKEVEVVYGTNTDRRIILTRISDSDYEWQVEKKGKEWGKSSSALTPTDGIDGSTTGLRTDAKGGIDFAGIYEDLKIKTDENGTPLSIQFQDLDQIQVEGFVPVIIQIMPMNNLPFLLGFDSPTQISQEIAKAQ